MKNLFLVLKTDVNEALRSKWFLVYTLIFGGIIALFFIILELQSQEFKDLVD